MIKRELLADNVFLNTIRTDKFKSNYLSVSFLVPREKRESALNTLLLRILKRGTMKYPDMISLSKKLEYLYSADIFTRVSSLGETQFLNFSIDAIDGSYALEKTDILGEAISVLSEIMYEPLIENGMFCNSYFESEKRNLTEEIDAEINNKGRYAFKRLCELMFADEKYGAPALGDRETVESITNSELYEHYKNVISSSKIEITFVGNEDEDSLKKSLLNLLDKHLPKHAVVTGTDVIRKASAPRYFKESSVGKQGNLVLGFRTGTVLRDGNYPVFALFCELYGGGAASKLFMNVREKMSLCYYCASIPEAMKGAMFVRAGIENKNYETAKDEILRQLSLIQNGEFSSSDLETAKLSLINAYREISDNPQSLETWYTGRMLSDITQSPDEAIAAVQEITAEEIRQIASKITLDTVYFLEGVDEGTGV